MAHIARLACAIAISGFCLAACGGGGDSRATAQNPGTGTQSPNPVSIPVVHLGVSLGASGAGGSRLLDDSSRYVVSPGTQVLVDGESATASTLKVPDGEVVLLSGQDNGNGVLTADHLEITHLLDAPVEAIDLTHSRMTVLGQTVLLNGFSCAEIACVSQGSHPTLGDRVLVSGYPLAGQAGMFATRVTASASSGDFLISGIIHSLDTATRKFSIGALTIDYAGAALRDFPSEAPREADRVIVRGMRPAGATEFTAASLTREPAALSMANGTDASLRGFVTSIESASVTVDGHPVRLTDAAHFGCPDPIGLNQDISVHGKFGSDSMLVADSACATHWDGGGDRITGLVDSVDPTFGTLSILGFPVQPSPATLLVNVSAQTPIQLGDRVTAEVGGPPQGTRTALRLEKGPGDSVSQLVILEEELTLARPSIVVFGRPIATNASTQFSSNGFPTVSGNTFTYGNLMPISSDQFFSGPTGWGKDIGGAFCGPAMLTIDLTLNADGSLSARAIQVDMVFC